MIGFYKVTGKSMEPSFREGDYVLVNRLSRMKAEDVVVLEHPKTKQLVLKRVLKRRKDKLFVIGDNSSHSSDSRSFGWVGISRIIGKVWWRIAKI